MKKKILILGGSGYIGTVLVAELLKDNLQIVNLDNLIFGQNKKDDQNLSNKNYKFLQGDLLEIQKFENEFKDVTDVVILAAIVGDPLSKKYPHLTTEINEKGVIQCLNFLNNRGINRVIFVSTCSNYGLIKENDAAAETHQLNPLSNYSRTKVNIENYILSKKKFFDFSPVILRFATAFGLSPRMRFDLTVNQFSIDLLFQKELEVYDPDTWRPYFHVKDFSSIISKILTIDKQDLSYEIFNVGSDNNNFTKRGIVKLISELIDIKKVKILKNGKDRRNYKVNFKKINQLYPLEAISVKQGIKEIVEEFEKGKFKNYLKNENLYGNYKVILKKSEINAKLVKNY